MRIESRRPNSNRKHYARSYFHGLHGALSASINLQRLDLEATSCLLPLSRTLPCTLTFSKLRALTIRRFTMGEETARILLQHNPQNFCIEDPIIHIEENIKTKIRAFGNLVVAIPKVRLQTDVWPSSTPKTTGDWDYNQIAVTVVPLDPVPIIRKALQHFPHERLPSLPFLGHNRPYTMQTYSVVCVTIF